jgi:hypothetical protein
MLWSHVEVARLGRVMRGLFRDVVAFRVVWELPIAGIDFTENRVEWLLNSSAAIH